MRAFEANSIFPNSKLAAGPAPGRWHPNTSRALGFTEVFGDRQQDVKHPRSVVWVTIGSWPSLKRNRGAIV